MKNDVEFVGDAYALTWRVGEAPTGRYKSFNPRSWPTAYYRDGKPAAAIYSDEPNIGYSATNKEITRLSVNVADHSRPGSFKWRTLSARFTGLTQAKQAAEQFLARHPEFGPKA